MSTRFYLLRLVWDKPQVLSSLWSFQRGAWKDSSATNFLESHRTRYGMHSSISI